MEPESEVIEILRKSGLKEGDVVLDFGCGSGTYSVPAAKIVGEAGKVYALDKSYQALDELRQKATAAGLKNMEMVEASEEGKINLADNSIDAVLLFDVFHRYYFPRKEEREKLLAEIHRVLKPQGSLLVWPKHMELEAQEEIEGADFHLESKYTGTLIHDNVTPEEGQVLKFKKSKKGKEG